MYSNPTYGKTRNEVASLIQGIHRFGFSSLDLVARVFIDLDFLVI